MHGAGLGTGSSCVPELLGKNQFNVKPFPCSFDFLKGGVLYNAATGWSLWLESRKLERRDSLVQHTRGVLTSSRCATGRVHISNKTLILSKH